MEERIIDDEYGRGIRLKKTKDGYVDVTDELTSETETEEDCDEVAFEFPEEAQEELDEEFIGLTPEELEKKLREKEEKLAEKKANCEILCAEADALFGIEDYVAATEKYGEAAKLLSEEEDEALAMRTRLGYWKSRTEDFTKPDEFVSDYIEYGVENFEYDVGFVTMRQIKDMYGDTFRKRMDELCEEEEPLCKTVKEKQEKRREYLKERLKTRLIAFGCVTLPMLVALGFAIFFAGKITSSPDSRYIVPTVVFAAVWLGLFFAFIVVSNRLLNAVRTCRANEKLHSTEDGERLVEIRNLKELYQFVLSFGEEKDTCGGCDGCGGCHC